MTNEERIKRWYKEDGFKYWLSDHIIYAENGRPIDFRDRRPLLPIVMDPSRKKVTVGCAQTGKTTAELLHKIWRASIRGEHIIYTMPTMKPMIENFYASKVQPLFRNNPWMAPTEVNRTGLISWKGAGSILFLPMSSENSMYNLTATTIFHDEVNKSDPAVVAGMPSRMYSVSEAERTIIYNDNPGRPLQGTDLLWMVSDQHMWHVTCKNCQHEQVMEWETHVCRKRRVFMCEKCEFPIDEDTRRNGRFVPVGKKDSEYRGYDLSHFNFPWFTADEMLRDFDSDAFSADTFNRMRLGRSFADGNLSVDINILEGSRRDSLTPEQRGRDLFMGVDVHYHDLYVTIWNLSGAVDARYLAGNNKWQDLDHLMMTVQPHLCCIDNGPVDDQVNFQKRWPGRVYRVLYEYPDQWNEEFRVDYKEGVIHAHRTRCIDAVIAGMASGKVLYYFDKEHQFWSAGNRSRARVTNCIRDHWGTMYVADPNLSKEVKFDKKSANPIRIWKHSGPDHFAHASVYGWIARQMGFGYGGGGTVIPGIKLPALQIDDDEDEDDSPRRRVRSTM